MFLSGKKALNNTELGNALEIICTKYNFFAKKTIYSREWIRRHTRV